MKKTFILLSMIAALASCGNNDSKPAGSTGTDSSAGSSSTASAPDLSSNPDYKKGLALIAQNDCLGCHKVDGRIVGPSYSEVAQRYAGKPGIEDSLANKIIKGGSGVWGDQVMTAHPSLSQDDAVAMVKYILLLKQ